jgi:hypothetical protein
MAGMIEQFDVYGALKNKLPKYTNVISTEWQQLWSGNFCSKKFTSTNFVNTVRAQKNYEKDQPALDVISESAFEACCYLSILKHTMSEEITFVELGAGWGGQLTNVEGAVKYNLVDTAVKSMRVLAVEAEPTHFKWLQETLSFNKIEGTAVFGAVSDKIGFVPFTANVAPGDSYGQAIRPTGNIQVPCYTLDYLVNIFKVDHINILSMDVQGEELLVLKGSVECIKNKVIDYAVIGTHKKELNQQIKDFLKDDFDCIIDYERASGLYTFEGFTKQVYFPQDGIMVLKRK